MPYVRDSFDVLGAFDQARWDAYQEAVRTGRGWEPNDVLEDPNAGLIFFNEAGEQDHYQPAPRPTGPIDNLPATKDPNAPFFGWTIYEASAYNTARGASGLQTDWLLARPKPWSTADIAENDRQLLAFAESSPKVQAALEQAKVGPFRGAAGQAAYEANEALAIQNQAEEILRQYLEYRNNMIRQNPDNWRIPLMPDRSFYGTDVSDAVVAALRALVAKLPPPQPPAPPPPPAPRPETTAVVAPTPASSSASANYPPPAPPTAPRPSPVDAGARASEAPDRTAGGISTAVPVREFPTKWVIGGFAALLGIALFSQSRDRR